MAEKAHRKPHSHCVTLTSSEDEGERDCMPKILNTISLQGRTDLSFQDETENEGYSFLYPECEIKDENSADEVNNKELNDLKEKTAANESIDKEETNLNKEKRKAKLTRIGPVKVNIGAKPKPSTSRRDDHYNVVDARRLALQESLFKTKELFDTFLRVCQDQENSEQMERVIEKLSRAYGQARQEFLGSLEFQNILESETEKVNTSNSKPWINLKLVLDEMKHNKKTFGSKLKLGDSEESQDAGGSNEDEPIIECPKKRRHLKKLEKTLRAINLKIKKLEEKEVDLSDDDSAYVKLDRYRTQFTKIYKKVCEIKGKLPDADRPYLRKVSFAGTTYPHINRCIERYYNKHRSFPDFQDIKKLVTIANQQEKIEMPPVKVHQMAAAAFKEFGEMLKRLRQYDDYDVIISYLDQQVDPAKNNEELQEELNKNAMLFKKKEQEVIDKFAAEDAGMHSNSEDNADSKPKRKINKITVTSSRKKPSQPVSKRSLSSSESSDEEEKEMHHTTKKTPGLCLSSSSSSDSEHDSEKVKKEPISGKGKTIVGKKKLVKQVSKISSPQKRVIPKTTLSSDEENTPNNTKDSFTNYLGLQVTSMKSETKETNIKEESDEEITCIKEIQKSSSESIGTKSNSLKNSSDSDSMKSKSWTLTDVKMKSNKNYASNEKPVKTNKSDKETHNKGNNNKEDNSSICSERTTIREKMDTTANKTVKKNNIKSNQNSKKVLHLKSNINSKKASSDSISDNSSDDRTSDASDFSEKKKNTSDLELSSGNKYLSDSSDNEDEGAKIKTVSDEDEPIILSEDPVILSEEVPLTVKPNVKNSEVDGSSDSDDVFVLSQNSREMRTVAPRRTKVNDTTNRPNKHIIVISQKTLPLNVNTLPRKRPSIGTSTPLRKNSNEQKRKLSIQSSSGNNNKRLRSGSSNSINENKQTIPQIINGAARKTIISRALPVCRSPISNESIPLIELD